jgi:hypothetical protein
MAYESDMPPAIGESGAAVLDDVLAYLLRFVSYPRLEAAVAHALWVAHTHAMDAWTSTPRIAFLSPEHASGKSRTLEVSESLVPRPVEAVNVTPAYLFRKVSDSAGRPTILFDEIDTVFGPKAKDNEDLRGLLNAGHRRHSTAGRCVVRGREVFTEDLPAYCAVAIAGLGGLPDTILSRSIVVRMRRRAPTETIEPYRRRENGPQGEIIRARLERWIAAIEPTLTDARAEFPDGICDRDADTWEALLVISDAAGGEWPKRARMAAVALVAESKGSTPSLGIQLLSDLREVFGQVDAMATETILHTLTALPESPWGDIHGRAIDARGLSRRLKEYGIKSKTVRIGSTTPKGYSRSDFYDAWVRYLPEPANESATSATSATATPDHFSSELFPDTSADEYRQASEGDL